MLVILFFIVIKCKKCFKKICTITDKIKTMICKLIITNILYAYCSSIPFVSLE